MGDKAGRAGALNNRGAAYMAKGDLDSALADFSEAIDDDPSFALQYMNRAYIYIARKQFDLAERDLDNAVRLPPSRVRATAFTMRADVRSNQGEWSGAVSDYEEAIRYDKKFVPAYNGEAWVLATCPESQVRDGTRAVTLALKAVELKDVAPTEDTLAAAYAEAGKFEDAVRTETSAIAKADPRDVATMRARLSLYQTGKPYRSDERAASLLDELENVSLGFGDEN